MKRAYSRRHWLWRWWKPPWSPRNSCQNSVVLALFYTTILLELAASAVEWHDVTDYGLCLGKDGAVVEIEKADESVTASDGRVPVLLYFERWDWIPQSYQCGLGSRDRNVPVLAPVLRVFVAVLFQKFWQTRSYYQWTHIVWTGRLCSAPSWRCERGGRRNYKKVHLKTHAPLGRAWVKTWLREGKKGREGKEDQIRFGALVICIDCEIIYYDNDISSIVSNDSFIEADSSVSLRTVQYSNRRGGWHDSNVKNVMEGRRRRGGGPARVGDLICFTFFSFFSF